MKILNIKNSIMSMKKCPYCAEKIKDEAIKCKHCGEWMNGLEQESANNETKSIIESKSEPEIRCDQCGLEYPSNQFQEDFPICNNCVQNNISTEYKAEDIESNKISLDVAQHKRYKKIMLLGFVLENFLLLGFFVPEYKELFKLVSSFTLIGALVLLLSTYQLCKIFRFSLQKSLFITVINVSLIINLITTIYLILKSVKSEESFSAPKTIEGYTTGIFICLLYMGMAGVANLTGILSVNSFLVLLFFILMYPILRKKFGGISWFADKEGAISIISGLLSLLITILLVKYLSGFLMSITRTPTV